jgi:hypothetical protein
MTTGSALAVANTNRLAFKVAGQSTQGCALIESLMQAAHTAWKPKAAANLAALAKVSTSTAERWDQGNGGISAVALANIIRSEEGFRFLAAVMGDAQPKWWRICCALMDVTDAQALQAAARRRLHRAVRGALDADRSITETIARLDAAAPFSGEDGLRPHADALGAATLVPGRAVAAPTRRR